MILRRPNGQLALGESVMGPVEVKNPEVSLVVLNWNSGQTIFSCLDSLTALHHDDNEVLVFDNGSTDCSVQDLEKRDDITLIRSERNLGFAGGNVAALPHCRGRYIGLINADAVLAPDWLDVVLGPLRLDDDVGAVGGRLYPWEEGTCSTTGYLAHHAVNPYTGEARTVSVDRGEPVEVASLSAAAVVLSRRAIDLVGYFDPGFFAYYEEVDLFARMIRAKLRIVHHPQARAWHRRASSLGETSFRYSYLVHRNRLRFGSRNFDRPYLVPLLRRWLATEAPIVAKLPLRHNAASRGRAAAAAANLVQLPRHLAARRQIVGHGSYNAVVRRLNRPLVSVIVTERRPGGQLAGAIASACRQTVPVLEVIVVHGAQPAEADERLIQLSGVRGGFAARCAVGGEQAKGEWLVFLDEDHQLDTSFVEEAYDAWLRRGDATLGTVSDPRRSAACRDRPVQDGPAIGSFIPRGASASAPARPPPAVHAGES